MGQWWNDYLNRQKKKEEKKKIKEEKKKKKYVSLIGSGIDWSKLFKTEEDNNKLDLLDSLVESIVNGPEIDDSITDDCKLEVLDLKETKPVRHRGNERYSEYSDALNSRGVLDFIKESLEKEDAIVVRSFDIAKNLGKDFMRKHHSSLYWGLKYVLFNEGIICEERNHKRDVGRMGKMLFMRKKRDGDYLPPSLESIRNKNKE